VLRRAGDWTLPVAWRIPAVLGVIVILAATWMLWPRGPRPAPPSTISAEAIDAAQTKWDIVYISGAVVNPGMYRIAAGQRVADVIVIAGGITADADTTCLPNLAAHVQDAKQYVVPYRGRCSRSSKVAKLDINLASQQQLVSVPGMDPDLARAIIQYRDEFGGFLTLTELKTDLGVDNDLYKELSRFLTVG
jgi:competence protein ComEA